MYKALHGVHMKQGRVMGVQNNVSFNCAWGSKESSKREGSLPARGTP